MFVEPGLYRTKKMLTLRKTQTIFGDARIHKLQTRLVSASRYNRRRLAGSVPAASRLADFPNKSQNDVWRRWNVSLGLGINNFDIHCDFGSYLFE